MVRSFCRRVAFSETDASGRAHFTAILKWVEDAEHHFLTEQGIPVLFPEGGWPRVSVHCDYRLPLAFGDEVEVAMALAEVGGKSLKWSFQLFNEKREVAAVGSVTTVYVEGGRAIEIPEAIRVLLESKESVASEANPAD